MPIQNAAFVGAFGNPTRIMKKQAKREKTIQEDVFDRVFLVSAQLVALLVLGIDYVLSGNVVMNFNEGYLTTDRDGVVHKHQFICEEETAAGVTEDLIPRAKFRVVMSLPTKQQNGQKQIMLQLFKLRAIIPRTPI
jgi:hypothetical protein